MYDSMLSSIIWYASWPVLIIVSYQLVRIGLRIFEKRNAKSREA